MNGRAHRVRRTRRVLTRCSTLVSFLAVALDDDPEVRVSTADPRFAWVSYSIAIEKPIASPASSRMPGVADRSIPLRSPQSRRRHGGEVESVPKAAGEVKKDLKAKGPKSNVQVSGDLSAFLSRRASSGGGDGGAGIYDPGSDTYLSIDFHGNFLAGPRLVRRLRGTASAG